MLGFRVWGLGFGWDLHGLTTVPKTTAPCFKCLRSFFLLLSSTGFSVLVRIGALIRRRGMS